MWIQQTSKVVYGTERNNIVFCDSGGKCHKVDFGTHYDQFQEAIILAELACPTALIDIENHWNHKILKVFFKDDFIERDLTGVYLWGDQEVFEQRLEVVKALYLNPLSLFNQLDWNDL